MHYAFLSHNNFFNQLADGFILDKTSSPLGVLLIIFESRPDALVQVKSRHICSFVITFKILVFLIFYSSVATLMQQYSDVAAYN